MSCPIKTEAALYEEAALNVDTHRLYHNIFYSAGPRGPAPLKAIVRASSTDPRIQRFDETLHKTVFIFNKRLGQGYMTLCYEGERRWTMMGSMGAEWLEFEYLNAKQFKVSKLLRERSYIICSFRNGGNDMESDIRNAFKILAQG